MAVQMSLLQRMQFSKYYTAYGMVLLFLSKCLQNSWRFALRRKFKRCRQRLVQDGSVAEMRLKYGRPGVSGRKRKHGDTEPDESGSGIQKVARFKVHELILECCLHVCVSRLQKI